MDGSPTEAWQDEIIEEDADAFAAEETTAVGADDASWNGSDAGASEDDEVYQAYTVMHQQRRSYTESRKKLKEIQKSRGFYKTDSKGQFDRQAAKQQEKERSRCGACNRLGHWAGDPECPKASSSGPRKFGKGGRKGKGRSSGGKSYMVSESPTFFSLGDAQDEADAFCNMVHGDDKEASDMEQDSGFTEGDVKRKKPSIAPSDSSWDVVDGSVHGYAATPTVAEPWVRGPDESRLEEYLMTHPVKIEDMRVSYVPSFKDVIPAGLMEKTLKVRELQSLCEMWNIHVSGSKAELQARLERLFEGKVCIMKGFSKRYVVIKEGNGPLPYHLAYPETLPAAQQELIPPKAKALALTKATSLITPSSFTTVSSTPIPKIAPKSAAARGKFVVDQMLSGNEDCRFFRSSVGQADETPKRDPRTGILVPEELEINQRCSRVLCMACGSGMVLRRNKEDRGLFFGCSRYSRCQATRTFKEVVDMWGASSSSGGGK